jgi:hypothetical protein
MTATPTSALLWVPPPYDEDHLVERPRARLRLPKARSIRAAIAAACRDPAGTDASPVS